jgi:ATP-binding cassette subfamily B protein
MKNMYKDKGRLEEIHVTEVDVLKQYWKAVRPYGWSVFFILLCTIASSIVEVFIPVFYKQFFDVLTRTGNAADTVPTLINIILYVLALNGAGWLVYRGMGVINARFQINVMADLKENAFDYMLGHSYTFFANRFTGSLVQRVNRFSRAFERLADRITFNIIPLGIRIIGIGIVLWYIKPAITIIIIVWTAVFLVFNYIFSRWKLKYDVERAAADSRSTAVLSDAITNHSTIQLFNGAEVESEYYHDVTQKQARITLFTWNLNAIIDGVQVFLMILAEFLLFYFTILYWRDGAVTVGTFVLIQAYLIGLGGRLWDFSRVIRDIYESFADGKEMVDILILPHDIKDRAETRPLVVKAGAVEFRDVTFYFNETRKVLEHFDLPIHGGEKVALVGPSGAGKSTVVRLLLRLYDVAGGDIIIDGQDIKHVTIASLRENIALVPQDPILFHRTLRENIRYGRRDATDDEVARAGKLAHCDEFIDHLPYGYDTYVGERGIKLSGGERQRIAIARAILKNAPILLLDEATSSLDSHSEALIQDALDKLMHGRTAIVIAHRLSTIRKMDRIVVIHHGKVIEEGKHDELSRREGSLYHKLWTLQAGGFLHNSNPAGVPHL